MPSAQLIQIFDAAALSGDADRYEDSFGDVARQVIESMAVRPGQQILEVGCGTGWATRRLGTKAPGAQAVGIDLSPEMIKRADAVSDWTARARFEVMDIEALDLPDAKFDHAFALGVLEFAPDLDRALREIARVMKKDGRFEILVRRFEESPASEQWAQALGVPMQWLDTESWTAALDDAGFEVESAATVQDERGPTGGQSTFTPTPWAPDEATRDALYEAGVLWIRAVRQ